MRCEKDFITYDEVFTFDNLLTCAKSCFKGVRWKPSTQIYETQMIKNVSDTYKLLKERKYKSKGFHTFYIHERGKVRYIQSVHISERVVQKCLCDYCLTPTFAPTFIYDNGACMKKKGTHFAVRRLKTHLSKYYREHGHTGYVLLFDLHNYFNSINHEVLLQKVRPKIKDDELFNIYKYFIDCFKGDGLGLGSQISQISASIYLNGLDHYIKEKLHIKGYGRYMDDSYAIHESKEFLEELLKGIVEIAGSLGITVNLKKTRICKLSDHWRFLQIQYSLTDTGRVIQKINPKRLTAMRRKMKKLAPKLTEKEFTDFFRSWFKNHYKIMSRYQRNNIETLFNQLKEVTLCSTQSDLQTVGS